MRLPFFMPSVEIGDEPGEVDRIIALAADLAAYRAGVVPTDQQLAEAPLMTGWVLRRQGEDCCFIGQIAEMHDRGPVQGITGVVRAVGFSMRWMRCDERLWRLGPACPIEDRDF